MHSDKICEVSGASSKELSIEQVQTQLFFPQTNSVQNRADVLSPCGDLIFSLISSSIMMLLLSYPFICAVHPLLAISSLNQRSLLQFLINI